MSEKYSLGRFGLEPPIKITPFSLGYVRDAPSTKLLGRKRPSEHAPLIKNILPS